MGTHKSKPKIQKFNLYKTIFLYAKAKICKFCKSNPHPSHLWILPHMPCSEQTL